MSNGLTLCISNNYLLFHRIMLQIMQQCGVSRQRICNKSTSIYDRHVGNGSHLYFLFVRELSREMNNSIMKYLTHLLHPSPTQFRARSESRCLRRKRSLAGICGPC